MGKKKCPHHIDTGLTPTDTTYHNHKSNLQQRFHNFHCKAVINCRHAMKGCKRHNDVPTLSPRDRLERLLLFID